MKILHVREKLANSTLYNIQYRTARMFGGTLKNPSRCDDMFVTVRLRRFITVHSQFNLITDSCCDLPKAYLDLHNVGVLHFTYTESGKPDGGL